jgi:hypothetical protein
MSNTRKLRPPAGGTGTTDEQGDTMTETSDTAAGPADGTPEDETGGTPAEEAAETGPLTVEFMGETFRLADRIGHFALLKFQRYMNTADPRAMEAVYQILETSIHEDDWQRFEDLAISARATDDDLVPVIWAARDVLMLEVAQRQPPRPVPQDRKPPARPRQQARRK